MKFPVKIKAASTFLIDAVGVDLACLAGMHPMERQLVVDALNEKHARDNPIKPAELFKPARRHIYQDHLARLVLQAFHQDFDLCREAVQEGREGLDEMTDAELIEYGTEVYACTPNEDLLK